MFKNLLVLAVLAVVLPCLPAQAAELKVGVVNMQRAMTETNDGKSALEKLRARLEAEYKILQAKQDEIKKIEDELNQQGYMLTESAKAEKQEKYRRLAREFEKYREEKNKDFVAAQKEATDKILRKLMEQVKKFAKAEGLSVVLESSSQTQGMPGSVVFFEEKMDITDKVIELYNKDGKGAEPAR